MKRSVLITGTSSGIGNSAVKFLSSRGFQVFATVRKPEDALKLKNETSSEVIPLLMDVTDEESIQQAFLYIEKIVGTAGLQGMVNNAGICIGQPIELMSTKLLHHELDVNLLGTIRVIKAFIPLIRKGGGRIVNISSTNGFISLPFMGGYCASKYGIEAISDTLRYELHPWRIPVSVICPDKIKSTIWSKSIHSTFDHFNSLSEESRNLYSKELEQISNAVIKMEKTALSTNVTDKKIYHALTSRRPKFTYLPDFGAAFQYYLVKTMPKRLVFKLIKKELASS